MREATHILAPYYLLEYEIKLIQKILSEQKSD